MPDEDVAAVEPEVGVRVRVALVACAFGAKAVGNVVAVEAAEEDPHEPSAELVAELERVRVDKEAEIQARGSRRRPPFVTESANSRARVLELRDRYLDDKLAEIRRRLRLTDG